MTAQVTWSEPQERLLSDMTAWWTELAAEDDFCHHDLQGVERMAAAGIACPSP